MERMLDMYRRGDMKEVWRRYCGFLDLSMDEFMATQFHLLEEQLQTWRRSPLMARIIGPEIPRTVAEFRERTPLTTYEDYVGALAQKQEHELPEPTFEWIHTSGRSGVYENKWIPYTRAMYDVVCETTMACFILGACKRHGHVALKERERFIFGLAPLPFISGLVMRAMYEQFNFRIWPPYEEAVKMDFFERIREGVRLAFSEGIDYFFGITSIMLNISEQLENASKSSSNPEMRSMLRNPKVLGRLLKGYVKSKLRGGPLRPRDLWNVKGIMCSGMDTSIYKERIRTMWGRYPWETYACAEYGFTALQHFASPGLVFHDKAAFYEFLELEEYGRWKADRMYRPRLRLLSEVETGKDYALVGTQLHGGVLARHVVGDSMNFVSLSDEKLGLKLPQMVFSSRIDDTIDIAGFTRLTEKTIWSAVEGSGLAYVDWVITKEIRAENPVLHLYLETKADGLDPARVREIIHERLKESHAPYRDLEEMAGIRPLMVTLLTRGTFARYIQERQAEGMDVAHFKPPHMNPKADVVAKLVALSSLRI